MVGDVLASGQRVGQRLVQRVTPYACAGVEAEAAVLPGQRGRRLERRLSSVGIVHRELAASRWIAGDGVIDAAGFRHRVVFVAGGGDGGDVVGAVDVDRDGLA